MSFILDLYNQFFLPSLILAFGGLVYFFKINKKFAFLTLGVFIFNSLGIIFLRKFGWGIGMDYIYRVYYLPAIMVTLIWLAMTLKYLADFIKIKLKEKSVKLSKVGLVIFYIIILTLPLNFFISGYQENDMSNFWVNYDYTKSLLLSLEPNSIYYFAFDSSINGDTELFTLIYLKIVEKVRPDVDVVSVNNLFYKDYYINLPPEFYSLDFSDGNREMLNLLSEVMEDRPLYTNFVVTDQNNDLGLFSISNGLAHRVFSDFDTAKDAEVVPYLPVIRGLDDIDEKNYAQAGFAAHYYYNLAAFYLVNGDFDQSQNNLIRALNLDTVLYSHEYTDFLDYREQFRAGYN